MQMNIKKLYLSNFFTGLVFWYGIEKLFMQSIGINAVGVGMTTAFSLTLNLFLDIPAGLAADRWSRKWMLFLAAIFMAASSMVLGISHGLGVYLIGYVFYSLYVVCTSGTYQAIMYDSLHELNLTDQYSKLMGRAFALFLAGAGVANVLSGFIASHFGYRIPFFITIASCVLNAILITTLTEPKYHKADSKRHMLRQIGSTTTTILRASLLRSLAIIFSALTIVELFKSDFGQLYTLRYVSTPELIGLLWASYAFTWSLGSLLAHRFKTRLNILIWLSVMPLLIMSFIDNRLSLLFFMIQAVASAALFNQIETRIQAVTPSQVRASVLSVLSSFGRAVSIPASLLIGWLIRNYNVYWALRSVTFVAIATLIYWSIIHKKLLTLNEPTRAEKNVPLTPETPASLT